MRKQWSCGEWGDLARKSWLGSGGVRFQVQLLHCGAHNGSRWAVLLLGPFLATNTKQATGAHTFQGAK